jgi:hypothetical protein
MGNYVKLKKGNRKSGGRKMSSIVYTVLLIVIVLFLVRKKTDEESNFPLKIIGYFILGSFAFNMNQISLPVGFVVYLLFFHPKVNGQVKRKAAVLGVMAFVVVHRIIPIAIEEWENRTITIEHKLDSIYTINLQDENELVKQELNVETDPWRLENLEVNYNENGRITDLNWQLISQNGNSYNLYLIRYATDKQRYEVTHSHSDSWLQYDRLIDADHFFENLNMLDIERMTEAKGNYSSFVIKSSGERIHYGIENAKRFIVVDGDVKWLEDERLPVECYYVSTYAMKKTGEERDAQGNIKNETFEGTEITDYLFDVNFDVE